MRYLTFALGKGRLAKQTLELFEKIVQRISESLEKIQSWKKDVRYMKYWILDMENVRCVYADTKMPHHFCSIMN